MEFKAAKTNEISEREKRNNELVRKLAPEGIVLLKNEGVLPLKETKKIALYGAGVRYTIKGGTGSGDVNTRTVVNIEEGFENAGVEVVTKKWLDEYDVDNQKAIDEFVSYKRSLLAQGANFLEVILGQGFKNPLHRVITKEEASQYSADTAVYVLSRNSGEGADRHNEENDYIISESELSSIKALVDTYENVIVALNIGGAVEMKKLLEINGLGAIILVSQPGNFVGNIVADVILGKSYPSGKLTTTWAYDYSAYPYGDEFSHMDGNLDDSYYKEGIYVGYKYFDTFGIKPAFGFGYGLSYTSFEWKLDDVKVDKTKVTVSATVTNTGDTYCGKEVLQVYISKPQGRLDQPVKNLAGFAKTNELKPGEKEVLNISFKMEDCASYDVENAQWILEAGDYKILLGNESENVVCVATVTVSETVVVEQAVNAFKKIVEFEELSNESNFEFDGENTYKFTMDKNVFEKKVNDYSKNAFVPVDKKHNGGLSFDDVKSGKITLDEFIMDLTNDELAYLTSGSGWENVSSGGMSIVGNAATQVPGAAGETTGKLKKRNVPSLIMADGPAGLRLISEFSLDADGNMLQVGEPMPFMKEILGNVDMGEAKEAAAHYYQYCTAIPIATMLAQSFNMELIETLGDMIGGEMEEFGVHLWLAPGMNIHKNVLCGRNFEYYSEDPFVSGCCAAAMTKGVQRHKGTGTTIKHFALNNQEENRLLNNSNVGERAIREIYLKGFEICVKIAAPKAIMTSYNLINGEHSATNVDLLSKVLRSEWGFDGLVMTDWGTTCFDQLVSEENNSKYDYSVPALCMIAGNDIIMPGFKKDVDAIIGACDDESNEYGMTINHLRYCARNVLKSILELVL